VRLVLDCSVAASWVFEDESDPLADRVLDMVADGQAVVPTIWPIEVASVLATSVRRKRISADQIELRMAYLRNFDIRVEDLAIDPARLAHLALDAGLSAYDAMYLELARRHALPLATLDKKLSNAARRIGVEIFGSE